MLTPELFEELLATYPAEKRELARQVYSRFAEGDSTQFFTQLFMLLDIYAHYAERVPRAVIAANQTAQASLTKLRDELNLLAQAMDKRNLNIANQAAKTDELCLQAHVKCDDTIARFDALLKNIGAQVDTQAIVAGIQDALETSINREVISPFVSRSEELAQRVIPTLDQIRDTAAQAKELWPGRIWKSAVMTGLSVGLALSILATTLICAKFKTHYEDTVAAKIAVAERVIAENQEAFREMAIAGASMQVVHVTRDDASRPGFAFIIRDAIGADMRPDGDHQNGCVFFASPRKWTEIQRMQQQTEKLRNSR
ncbi:hypothetical protein SBV1_3200005 [Verrucomicrobia bacterium]|nr:hypothetical protein SBV1_3200005 [Verrucomicrobiota bacterium]